MIILFKRLSAASLFFSIILLISFGCANIDRDLYLPNKILSSNEGRLVKLSDGMSLIVSISRSHFYSPWKIWIAPYGVSGKHRSLTIERCIVELPNGDVFLPENMQSLHLKFWEYSGLPENNVTTEAVYSNTFKCEFSAGDTLAVRLLIIAHYQDGTNQRHQIVRTYRNEPVTLQVVKH